MTMIINGISNYLKALDEFYDKPPRDVSKKVFHTLTEFPCDFLCFKYGGAIVIKFHKGIYGIAGVIVYERNKDFGTCLMEKIHKKYKGIFLLKTSTAKKFYEKLGYRDICSGLMVYANKNIVRW